MICIAWSGNCSGNKADCPDVYEAVEVDGADGRIIAKTEAEEMPTMAEGASEAAANNKPLPAGE
jgi:hypothetical protein